MNFTIEIDGAKYNVETTIVMSKQEPKMPDSSTMLKAVNYDLEGRLKEINCEVDNLLENLSKPGKVITSVYLVDTYTRIKELSKS